MNKSIIITSEGQTNTHDFTVRMQSPIDLQGLKWNLSLHQLTTYYSWWNISSGLGTNIFKYFNGLVNRTLTLEEGQYSFVTLVDHIHDKMIALGDYTAGTPPLFDVNFEMDLSDGFVTMLLANGDTVDFTGLNIRTIFGFASQIYNASTVAPKVANIRYGTDLLQLHVDVIGGNTVYNGVDSDVIYTFGIGVQPNEIIEIEPNNSLSIGVNRQNQIDRIRVYLTDQAGTVVNLRGSLLSCVFLLSPVL